jgi:hypothetical protein
MQKRPIPSPSRRARRFVSAAILAGTMAAGGAAVAQDWGALGQRWWDHVRYLASDEFKGRQTGSPEYDKAADYVAKRFAEYGLKPAGVKGYFQPVAFTEQKLNIAGSKVSLVDGGRELPLVIGQDVILPAAVSGPGALEPDALAATPMVFIGYGLRMPKAGYDDFSRPDLRGKVVVVINGGPAELPAAMKSHARASETRRALQAVGAVGIVSILTPKSNDVPWERRALLQSQPRMFLADPNLKSMFNATINPEQAEKLFAKSGHAFKDILALADDGKPLPGFPLNLSVSASIQSAVRPVTSSNIVGVLPGSDPRLKAEYVMVSAHLDHLGVGEPIKGDSIYNGAIDDASGVATVLEVARGLKDAKARPKRSLLFLAFTGEEKGLLGSSAFADHPTVPKAGLAADLNLDMFMPLWPLTHIYAPGVDESSLSGDIAAVASAQGIKVVPDPYPDRNVFTRTDQYSFVRAGVPAVALKFGFALGSPQQQIEKDWRTNRYHAPSDDVDQPFDPVAAAKFNSFVSSLAMRLADAPTRPKWKADSIFAPTN